MFRYVSQKQLYILKKLNIKFVISGNGHSVSPETWYIPMPPSDSPRGLIFIRVCAQPMRNAASRNCVFAPFAEYCTQEKNKMLIKKTNINKQTQKHIGNINILLSKILDNFRKYQ